jgi:hypothetical protein
MDTKTKRILLYLVGCIGLRTLFAYIAKTVEIQYLPYLGALALLPVVGWLYIIFIGKRDTGFEVFGEKIWWKKLRIVHVIIYLLFAVLALMKHKCAWLLLLTDVLIGLATFIMHHSMGWVF